MASHTYNCLIGISCSLNIMSAGISMTFGWPWGSLVLLLGTIIGSVTIGYRLGFEKAKMKGDSNG